jgi:prepilin-type processing-associated H-X9-DG protein/prepilin-type N-terminal cleavage/methylation domain-containing protein
MLRNRGLTIVELLIVISIITLLTVILFSALGMVRSSASNAQCCSNLRHLGEATACYLNDNGQTYFKYQQSVAGGTLWYFGFEPKSGSKKEGERQIDLTRAPLYNYGVRGDTANCPELTAMFRESNFKPKFVTQTTSYGYNTLISGRKSMDVNWPAETILFADCAQINTFQAPASRSHPLIEEFYIVGPGFKTIHYRHNGHANAVFCDGHVGPLYPIREKLDTTLPHVIIGEADKKLFFLESAKK